MNEVFYPHYKNRFEYMGFVNLTFSGLKRDALNMLIDETRPRLVIIGADFYNSALSYMVGRLIRWHKGINVAVVSTGPNQSPPDIGMACIANGVKSYIRSKDGIEQFYRGFECVRNGKSFISWSVLERMEMRDEMPRPSVDVTEREIAVVRCVRNGFTGPEIAEELDISLQTVNFHKKEMYMKFGLRNENELIEFGYDSGLILHDEKKYFPSNFELKPKIKKVGNGKWEMEKEKTNIRSFYDYKN